MSKPTLDGLCTLILGVMPDAAQDQPTPELTEAADRLFETFGAFVRAAKSYADEKIIANTDMNDLDEPFGENPDGDNG